MEILGHHTPHDLHQVIFEAFGRLEEHLHEFNPGKGLAVARSCSVSAEAGTANRPAPAAHVLLRRAGSKRSRRLSPMKLAANTTSAMAMPGKVAVHQAMFK